MTDVYALDLYRKITGIGLSEWTINNEQCKKEAVRKYYPSNSLNHLLL